MATKLGCPKERVGVARWAELIGWVVGTSVSLRVRLPGLVVWMEQRDRKLRMLHLHTRKLHSHTAVALLVGGLVRMYQGI